MDFQLTPEQRDLQQLVREIARTRLLPLATRWDQTHEFPWESMHILAEAGVLGLTIPERFGGLGRSWFEAVIAIEEVARVCYQTAMAVLGELGVQAQAIVHYGSEAQQQTYLPAVARGELVCAICMTEPDAGSDVGALHTRATEVAGGYVINGSKLLISRADVAGLFLTFVRFGEAPGSRGVGAVLIDRDAPGLEIGPGDETLGGELLFPVYFHDLFVTDEQVLVREHGFRKLMSAFNGQRCLNATISLGQAQGAFDLALDYVQSRKQFGQRLADFQGLQWLLADMSIDLDAARLMIYRAAANAGGGLPDPVEAAKAKTFANEAAIRVSNQAMQMFGGHGYLKSMQIERYVRGARFGSLAGGTPQIQRNIIANSLVGRRRD